MTEEEEELREEVGGGERIGVKQKEYHKRRGEIY